LSKPVNTSEQGDYRENQVSVSGGDLHLTAIATPSTVDGVTYNYQSGLIHSSTYGYAYGYCEARIYTPPASPGVIANWPAWWLTGQSWPTDGEIDIMESLNGHAASTFHSATNPNGLSQTATGDYTGWHNYGVLWTPGELQFYYDGNLQHTVTTGVTSVPLEMVLNYAVSSSVGGPTTTPATMLVDYVHVYQTTQYDPSAVAVTPQAGYGGPGDNGTPTPTPTPTPTSSPNGTVVKGTTGTITDASGNNWTITAGGQVAVNGIADTRTAGVIELAYVNGTIWQENSSDLWWGETTPNASWAPTAGTATSPLPATSTPTPSPDGTTILSPSASHYRRPRRQVVSGSFHKCRLANRGKRQG
jgi:hypothetical protein